ncbi:MAG TPA: RecX family transcriptional regulator [Acetobacteraceae bacterium]|nr:RecX family transcriptional regulator [Acetobacteraceae bacterium]
MRRAAAAGPARTASASPAGAPDAAALHEAALAHLGRYAATRAGLLRVLHRRIERWARMAGSADAVAAAVRQARVDAASVVAALVRAGALDDAAFAAGRVRSLARSGRSGRAIEAHLRARGVDPATARAALPDDPERELAAALVWARRRRLGPFRAPDPATAAAGPLSLRERAALARAGFGRGVVETVLRLTPAEAEDLLLLLRRR